MYPTKQYPGYGSFVKNVCDTLTTMGINQKFSAVIKGRAKTKYDKIKKYLKFYYDIFINYWKKYDFIYIHFPNQAIPILFPLLTIKKKKLVVNFHGEDLIYPHKGYGKILGKMMERCCHKYANAIVVPSEYFKKIATERNIIDSSNIIVSGSGGIDPKVFYPKEESYPNSLLHLGYVGRMEIDKGIVEFLSTCKKLKERDVTFRATAIGYGSYYSKAEEYINQNKLENVKLIPGLPQNELGDYYRAFDLLIFSSSSRTGESLGLTGIEAMACGTPVIGSNIGGIATYVKSGVNGWLTPIGDVGEIMKRILEYEALPGNEKKRMFRKAIETGEKYYSNTVCEKLYSDLKAMLI